jgi:hypothetical protein
MYPVVLLHVQVVYSSFNFFSRFWPGFNALKSEILHKLKKSTSYLAADTLRLSYKDQPVNAV